MLIPTRQACQRPPGARFFLHQRRKNRGRKTPLRAGGGPPALRTHPCIPRRGCSRTLYGVPGRFVGASVPCELVSKPLAASLLLTGCCGDLQATVVGGPQHRTVVTLRAGACSGAGFWGAAEQLVRCIRCGGGPSVLCDALGDRKTARREPGGLEMMRFFGSSRCACRMLGEAFPLSRWCNA